MSAIQTVMEVLAGNGSDEARNALANPQSDLSKALEEVRKKAAAARSGHVNWSAFEDGDDLSKLFDGLQCRPITFIGTSEDIDVDSELTSRRA